MAECEVLAAAAAGMLVILMGPMPRYVAGCCCTDPSHTVNYGKEEYKEDILDAQKMQKYIISNLVAANILNSCYLCHSSGITQ
jgi:hypothetical protein